MKQITEIAYKHPSWLCPMQRRFQAILMQYDLSRIIIAVDLFEPLQEGLSPTVVTGR
jgi:hypothetical protein